MGVWVGVCTHRLNRSCMTEPYLQHCQMIHRVLFLPTPIRPPPLSNSAHLMLRSRQIHRRYRENLLPIYHGQVRQPPPLHPDPARGQRGLHVMRHHDPCAGLLGNGIRSAIRTRGSSRWVFGEAVRLLD